MTDNRIYSIPPLPKAIVDAVNNDKLAIFIGAGVSRLIGCMGWDELAQNLTNRCFSTKKEDGSPCINFNEKDTLSEFLDHKKTITICYSILKQNGFEDIFFEELEKSLDPNPELLKSKNIYDELYHLRGLFITTNADRYFADHKFNPMQSVYKDFNPSGIDRTKLYHIHGLIPHRNSLVFTVPQYIQRYTDNPFRKFLETIFNEYVVLFVGYGMSEFELLDFLITKFDSNNGRYLKHFILMSYSTGGENSLVLDQHYYNSMGISVLGYEKAELGHGQLYNVIKRWSSEISQTSNYLYDSLNEIDEVIDNYGKH